MEIPSNAGRSLAEEMRELAARMSAARSALFDARKRQDGRARESILTKGKRLSRRADEMYDYYLGKIHAMAADGRNGPDELDWWPDEPIVRRVVEVVAERLKKEGFQAEWKPETDTGRDGFGNRLVILMKISW